MADKNLLSQMLAHLVEGDQAKAEELFHEYVVSQSREIYESLIESEMKDDEDEEEVDEAADADKDDEEKVDEEFEDVAFEADDEEGEMGDDGMGGDATDDLEAELDGDEEDMSEKEPEELFQDLNAIVDELQAKFDEMNGDEMGDDEGEMGDDEMGGEGGNPFAKEEDFELETVREYVEKVSDGHGAEKKGKAETADAKKSLIDNMKNDMGGTTANILSSKEDAATFAAQGQLKGNGLAKGTAKVDDAGNINVPGAKVGKSAFTKKEPGHGAEKKGAGEGSTDGQSLFRGRR